MGKFDGKRLLMLGTSVGSVEIVKYAKSEGAYVIVTDYLTIDQSEAKQYADETAMISTLDVEALYTFAKEKRVDTVFCGVSESNLLSVNRLAERLGLPYYLTMEQWNSLENKANFKELCMRFHVPVAKPYHISDQLLIIDSADRVFPIDIGPRSGGNMIPDLLGLIFGRDVVEMSVRAAMGQSVNAEAGEGSTGYATLNLHSDRAGQFAEIRFSRELQPFIIRKSIYKKPGDPVSRFSNAADALGIVFFRFPDQKTMLWMEEHMNEHVRIVLQGEPE